MLSCLKKDTYILVVTFVAEVDVLTNLRLSSVCYILGGGKCFCVKAVYTKYGRMRDMVAVIKKIYGMSS